ncbi:MULTISPECIES: type IV pilin-like G/H family protein [Pseudanabaena]|uniref:type IV pilin-like G/H family protein n=1 Tax=Pseudanabaena TaxID=1152 RepID=UPI0024797720|nr:MULTISPECIES: type IV pilin-like G/H family protein [Pseudanabaena]MEA5488625.1 type IV pilin-like G/H family protein [Pseudanabaena sp. CCNP1317]
MKSEFKTKLIQHMLNKKNGEKGFTLIELLVVIIIIGILAAIALPSFLNQAAKARQSEAKTYVGSANRAQQAYYLEKQRFADSLTNLSIGVAATTENYTYTTLGSSRGTTGTDANAYSGAVPREPSIKAYVGAVNLATPQGSGEATTLAALCEGKLPPVNGGASSIAGATAAASVTAGFVLNTSLAPVCANQADTTGFVPVN